MRLPVIIAIAACSAGPDDPMNDPLDPVADTGLADSALVHQFSFVVVADPHVTGPGEHLERLGRAVDWIHDHRDEHDLRFVVILGDICWGNGFVVAHESLDKLTIPWVPVMGDNVIQTGGASTFHSTFSDQIDRLSAQLDAFEMAPTPVPNPERGGESWLQNIRFQYGDVRFLAADWNSREVHAFWGQTPDLHNFNGGTWPWLAEQLSTAATSKQNSVVLLSHIPLFEGPGGLTEDEAEVAVELLAVHEQRIWANLAGHLHIDSSMNWERAGMEIHVTDATWDDVNRVRVVKVSANERRVAFDHWVVDVP